MSTFAVLGEALIDLVPEPDDHYAARPGGSPFNVAIGLARLGQPTQLLARLAEDGFGRQLRRRLTDNGVGLEAAISAAEPTTLAVAMLDETGQALYSFYRDGTADWQWTADELRSLPADTTVLHTGSLASWLTPGADRIAELVTRLAQAGEVLISYDPNIRPDLFTSPEQARTLVERSIAAAHVVKASDEDLAWLYPGEDVEALAAQWLTAATELVVITRGGDGMSGYTRDLGRVDCPGRAVTVVDTIGAGDASMAALLDGLAGQQAAHPGGPAGLGKQQLAAILDHAALVAALTCARVGADPPTAAEVAAAVVK